MTPELEQRIRSLLAQDAPLKTEEGWALLKALDDCARLMSEHLYKRAMTVRMNLKQRIKIKEYASRISDLEKRVKQMSKDPRALAESAFEPSGSGNPTGNGISGRL